MQLSTYQKQRFHNEVCILLCLQAETGTICSRFFFYEWGQQNRLTHLLFFSCPICLPKEQQLTAPVRLPLIIYSYLHIITKDGRHLRVSLKARDDVSSVNSRLQSLLPTVPSVQHLPMLSHGASNSLSLSDLLH